MRERRTSPENREQDAYALQRNFYYANTYFDNEQKVQNMPYNVYFDLEPFVKYIKASIAHIKESTSEGADVKILSDMQERHLVPQFSLVRGKGSGATFAVPKPQDIFVLSADEDFATDSFKVFRRQDEICSSKDVVDVSNGKVFVKISWGGGGAGV